MRSSEVLPSAVRTTVFRNPSANLKTALPSFDPEMLEWAHLYPVTLLLSAGLPEVLRTADCMFSDMDFSFSRVLHPVLFLFPHGEAMLWEYHPHISQTRAHSIHTR